MSTITAIAMIVAPIWMARRPIRADIFTAIVEEIRKPTANGESQPGVLRGQLQPLLEEERDGQDEGRQAAIEHAGRYQSGHEGAVAKERQFDQRRPSARRQAPFVPQEDREERHGNREHGETPERPVQVGPLDQREDKQEQDQRCQGHADRVIAGSSWRARFADQPTCDDYGHNSPPAD